MTLECHYCGQTSDGPPLVVGRGGEWCHALCRAAAVNEDNQSAGWWPSGLTGASRGRRARTRAKARKR